MRLRGAFYLAGPLGPWLAGLLAGEFPGWRRQAVGARAAGFVRFRGSPRGARRLVALAREVPLALLVGGAQAPKAKAWLSFTRRAGLSVFVPEDPRVAENWGGYDFFVYTAADLARGGPFMPPAVASGFRGAGIYDRGGSLVLPDPAAPQAPAPSEAAPQAPAPAPQATGGGATFSADWSIEAVAGRNASSGAVVPPPEGVNLLLWRAFMGPERPSRARFSPPRALLEELRKFNGCPDPFIGLYTERLAENFPTSLDIPTWYRPAFGGVAAGAPPAPPAPPAGGSPPSGRTGFFSAIRGFFGGGAGKAAAPKGVRGFINIAAYCCLVLFIICFARAAIKGFRGAEGDLTIKVLSGGAKGVAKTAGAVAAMVRGES